MQQNGSTGYNHDQQTGLPSYAEAIRTAPPPSNLHHSPNVNVDETHRQPSAPVLETTITRQTSHTPYPIQQANYNQTLFPSATVCSYPSTYATNVYPQYAPNSGDSELGPRTIHIIRPVSTQPQESCCSGRILSIVLGIVILCAILRATLHAYF